jgi:small-conductance mechanosensitive channel
MQGEPISMLLDRAAGSLAWLTQPLFTLGDAAVSTATLLKLLLLVAGVVLLGRLVRRLLSRRVFPRLRVEPGSAYALAKVTNYAVVALGLLVALQTIGLDVSTLTVLFGALGIGVGFGLQPIASNFVSGLIILLERPIQVNDHVEIGKLHGRVVRIRMRSTEILTNDQIAVVIPNNDLTSQPIINWSRGEDFLRQRVSVGVAYGSDPAQVRAALLEAARSVPAALQDPPPSVRLEAFGDSAMRFTLLACTRELLHRRGEFTSRLNFAVHDALKRHGITIPFPQRDLHLKTAVPLSVERPAPQDTS